VAKNPSPVCLTTPPAAAPASVVRHRGSHAATVHPDHPPNDRRAWCRRRRLAPASPGPTTLIATGTSSPTCHEKWGSCDVSVGHESGTVLRIPLSWRLSGLRRLRAHPSRPNGRRKGGSETCSAHSRGPDGRSREGQDPTHGNVSRSRNGRIMSHPGGLAISRPAARATWLPGAGRRDRGAPQRCAPM
jgi:hypothetical protein